MKTNLLLVMMLVSALTATAQFNKGRMLVAGEFSFRSQKNTYELTPTTTTTTSVGFSPAVGYFFIDNLAVGLALNASASRTAYEDSEQTSNTSSISIGPFVRYYLQPGVFFQGTAGFGSQKSRVDFPAPSEDWDYNTGMTTWDVGVGYAYFLNDYVALEPIIGYQASKTANKDNDNESTFGALYINAALTIYLGERN